MPSNQLDIETTQDFRRFLEYEKTAIKSSQTLKYALEYITKPNLKILDIGGASGLLLDQIIKSSPHPIHADLLEVNPKYKEQLANKKITFIEQSILDNAIPDQCYDLVVFRHVLHHLVGDTLQQTRKNQVKMLSEIFRITKKGGIIIFEEEVNNNELASNIIFFISKVAVRLGIKIKRAEIGKVVVKFMSEKQVEKAFQKHQPQVIVKEYTPWYFDNIIKFSQLMNKAGSMFYVLRNS